MNPASTRGLGSFLLLATVAIVAFLLFRTDPSDERDVDLTPVENVDPSSTSSPTLGDGVRPDLAANTTRQEMPTPEAPEVAPPTTGFVVRGTVTGPSEPACWEGAIVALCAGPAVDLELAPRSGSRSFGSLLNVESEFATTHRRPEPPLAPLAQTTLEPDHTFALHVEELPPTFHVRVFAEKLVQTSHTTWSAPAGDASSERVVTLPAEVVAQGAALVEGYVVDPQGMPVPDVEVGLREVINDLQRFRSLGRTTERLPRYVRTDAQGRFAFRCVHPGEELALCVGRGEGAAHESARVDHMTIAAGEHRTERLQLGEGNVVEGTVRTKTGGPVASARVLAGPSAIGFGHLERVDDPTGSSASTDAEGRFRIAGLGAGAHFVVVEAQGFAPSDVVTLDPALDHDPLRFEILDATPLRGVVRMPNGNPAPNVVVRLVRQVSQATFMSSTGRPMHVLETATDAAGEFVFDSLEEGTFDLRAETPDGLLAAAVSGATNRARRGKPRDPVVLELAPFAVFEGRVVEASGRPVTQFDLELCTKALAVLPATRARGAFRSDDGRFRIDRLLPGKYELHVAVEGREPHLQTDVVVPSPDGFTIALPAVGDVRGVVYEDPGGAPLEGVSIHLVKNPFEMLGDIMLGQQREVVTDADGAFTLTGLPAGKVSLAAKHETFVTKGPFEVEVLPGEMRGDVILRMTRGGVIEGHVFGDEGLPQAGVTVEAQTDLFGLEKVSATTDAEGFYRLHGMPSGQARMSAIDLAAMSEKGMAGLLASVRTKAVRVEPGATVVVNFGDGEAGTRLLGTVTINGEKARGVMLFATFKETSTPDDVRLASSDAKGDYVFENVPKGKCDLRVIHMGSHGQSVHPLSLTIPDVREHRFDVSLEVGRLSGKVATPDGEPLVGVQVTLSSPSTNGEDPFFAFATTDEDGRYSFDGLRSGTYEVRAGGPQFLLPGENVTQTARSGLVIAGRDELADIDFVLTPGGTIEGIVVDDQGKPISTVALYAEPEGTERVDGVPHGITGADGKFRLQGVRPGVNRVRTQARGYLDEEQQTVNVVPGNPAQITITLRRGIRVRVAIVDANGARLEGARPMLVNETGNVVTAGVTPQNFGEAYGALPAAGFLEVGAFRAGDYKLRVDLPDGKVFERAVTLRGAPGSVYEETVRIE